MTTSPGDNPKGSGGGPAWTGEFRTPAAREAAAYARAGGSRGLRAEGEGLHRLLVESVRDYAIFALDPAGYILSWNLGAERLKGYTVDEILGKHFSIFYPPEDIARGKPPWELEVAAREGRLEDEGWRLRKDGTRFWANVIITALRGEDGELVGFAKVTRDLTERRAAEEAIRQSEARFRQILGSVRDYAIFMLDTEGRVVSWNEGAEQINGYRADEILGRHLSTFYREEDVAAGMPELELRVAAAEGRYEDEGWRVRKDGSPFWANVVVTAIRDEQKQLLGFAKVTRDLTERRATEERTLADARRLAEAEASNRTKAEFLAAMSHELRTPLNAIGGYAELIAIGVGGPVTDQQREYLARIRGSQQHLLGIINDLLNYSRIEAGQVAYDMAEVSIREVVETVVAMVMPQATAKGLTLERGACAAGILAWADRTKAEQVTLNLLSNAVKFTPAGGHVVVACAASDEQVFISVRDTGPGIPADKLDAIFEPFVQLGRSLTSAHEGTGLGLAISRDLARAMGGDVTVESTPGSGATFTLALRRSEPSSRSRRPDR
jgi:PAS domain S-box-containing protein